MGDIDQTDWRIIDALQKDASESLAVIGEKVGLSQNACWRRIKRLEETGVLNSPLKKALLTGFHSTAKHNATKAVSPSSETMRTI